MRQSPKSMLHLQMGQEVLYLLMTVGLLSSLVLFLLVRYSLDRTEEQRKRADTLNDRPPIVILDEASGYFFKSGSAEIGTSFRSLLRKKIVPQLESLGKEYDAQVIEVIGHTDEQPLGAQTSNMDTTLIPRLNGDNTKALIPADNIGLGMARAVSIATVLADDARLKSMVVLPLSAGPTTLPSSAVAKVHSGVPVSEKARRRIEIRIRRHFGKPK